MEKQKEEDGTLEPAKNRTGVITLTSVLFMSFVAMCAGRDAISITVVQMAEDFQWDKAATVSTVFAAAAYA